MITTLTRPNGKLYRPRKVEMVAHAWENQYDSEGGCIVFGTQDIAEATETAKVAVRRWFGCNNVTGAYSGWFRLGFATIYGSGELTWIDDTVKGRPGVYFTATDT